MFCPELELPNQNLGDANAKYSMEPSNYLGYKRGTLFVGIILSPQNTPWDLHPGLRLSKIAEADSAEEAALLLGCAA